MSRVRDAKKRALLAVATFAFFGIIVGAYTITNWVIALPLVVFYATLLFNTYFSVRRFATITPRENIMQQAIDAVLALLYLALPFFFIQPQRFLFITVILFATSTAKYVHLTKITDYPTLLWRKIKVNSAGMLGWFLVFAATFTKYETSLTIVAVTLFLLANIYVLWINPLYRLPSTVE